MFNIFIYPAIHQFLSISFYEFTVNSNVTIHNLCILFSIFTSIRYWTAFSIHFWFVCVCVCVIPVLFLKREKTAGQGVWTVSPTAALGQHTTESHTGGQPSHTYTHIYINSMTL